MPIYEYRCTACSTRFEFLQTHRDDPAPPCPQCGTGKVDRLLSAFAVGAAPGGTPSAGPCGANDCACVRRGIESTS